MADMHGGLSPDAATKNMARKALQADLTLRQTQLQELKRELESQAIDKLVGCGYYIAITLTTTERLIDQLDILHSALGWTANLEEHIDDST